jgi:hypothetical protein
MADELELRREVRDRGAILLHVQQRLGEVVQSREQVQVAFERLARLVLGASFEPPQQFGAEICQRDLREIGRRRKIVVDQTAVGHGVGAAQGRRRGDEVARS